MLLLLFCLIFEVPMFASSLEVERIERVKHSTWHLAMNLNPADGHIMDYMTGWADDIFIGTYTESLTKDYRNRVVCNYDSVQYIAIARHQRGEMDAVKVFRLKEASRSLLQWFQDALRDVVTEGGPLQESVSNNAQNMDDDPIFSVGGDLAFNWVYSNNGVRIVLTGGHLSPANSNDENTHGLGNHISFGHDTGKREISNIQDCPYPSCFNNGGKLSVQGTDHGADSRLLSLPSYGNYAVYISKDASSFPEPGYKLGLEIDVVPKLKFCWDC